MPKFLINFASRSRPTKLIAAIENIQEHIETDDYIILVTLDVDDTSCATKEFNEKLKSYKNVMPVYGFSKGKIHAINRSIWMVNDFKYLLNHSDDFWITKKGFDKDIEEAYSDGFSGLVHFPDGFVNERLCTYTIYDKAYYDRFGYIYEKSYLSVFSDNEQHAVAKKLNSYRYVDKKIFEHRHFVHGFGEKDELLKQTEDPKVYAQDRNTFECRKKNNFYL